LTVKANNKTSCRYRFCFYYTENVMHYCSDECRACHNVEMVISKILDERQKIKRKLEYGL
ncbi:MAG: hypothetical protein ACXADW_23375, partial [Candidatus Hodarchaeales archaeon]